MLGCSKSSRQCNLTHLLTYLLTDLLDEVVGYAVAALGFYYQYAWGFALPFPLSLLFFPLSWIEWYIRWAVTSTASIA